MKIKIFIADDHSMIREGIKQLIELESDLKVVGFANNGMEAIEKIEKLKPDVVLLDINMPVLNGMDTLVKLKESNLEVKVIMLTIHNESEYIIRAMKLGCDGYILKEANSAELKNAIYTVYNGGRYIYPVITPILNQYLVVNSDKNTKFDKLTNRELQILKILSEGLTNREIAERLDISDRTVKNHVFSILKKLNVKDRTQAAVIAVKNDIVKM
ncbi:MAG: response regulator transcription factor [Lachnospiraceae bacterium]|nr:response regulator transcription factor [Lachnospiraceae bacterium]